MEMAHQMSSSCLEYSALVTLYLHLSNLSQYPIVFLYDMPESLLEIQLISNEKILAQEGQS